MAELLAVLMTFVGSLLGEVKPVSLPPVAEVESSSQNNFGSQVSSKTPEEPKEDGKAFGKWVSEQAKQKEEEESTFEEDVHPPETTGVATENVSSEMEMPTAVPSVAVENSPALEPSTGTLPLPSEKQEETQSEETSQTNTNASFGQEVSSSVPEAAKTDGQTFGQATSELAKENGKKP